MAKMTKYIPGDPWFICDLCGFQVRRSQIRKNWKNQMVCPEDYEPKHPQLSIRPVQERTAVVGARPEGDPVYLLDPNSTTLAVNAARGATSIAVSDASGMSDGDYIAVVTDDGTQIWTTVDGTPIAVTDSTGMGDPEWNADYNTPPTNEPLASFSGKSNVRHIVTDAEGEGCISLTTFPITAGKSYNISYDLYVNGGKTVLVQVRISGIVTFNGDTVGSNSVWSTKSKTVTAINSGNALVWFRSQNSGATEYYIDNVYISGVKLTNGLSGSAASGNKVYYTSSLGKITADDL